MQTKILIIVGVSVASVLALFVLGFFLDKDATKKEKTAAASNGRGTTSSRAPSPPSSCSKRDLKAMNTRGKVTVAGCQ